ncbi:hypothetical protein BaRGS_00008172 [Batillaria attramentaria]|uniref:Uncharacterized protein n=1 Tax=Batillaria attramentaria TaxID=370345 RepID=A0ABD0LLW1_9CAEN
MTEEMVEIFTKALTAQQTIFCIFMFVALAVGVMGHTIQHRFPAYGSKTGVYSLIEDNSARQLQFSFLTQSRLYKGAGVVDTAEQDVDYK